MVSVVCDRAVRDIVPMMMLVIVTIGSGEGGHDHAPVLDALGGDHAVARIAQFERRTAHHDDLEAVIVIEMYV